ncbi:M60 family metallopeptidase [Lachnospiraceae bacterium 45-W7]
MKRLTAVLLTASLIFQAWTGDVMLSQGASLPEDTVLTEEAREVETEENKADAGVADVREPLEEVPDLQEGETTEDIGLLEGTQNAEPQEKAQELESQEITDSAGVPEDIANGRMLTGTVVPEERSVLEVEVTSAVFPVQGKLTVQVSGGSESTSQARELDFSDADTQTARFSLSPGAYIVQIQAAKFATYSQAVEMEDGYHKKIRVCTAETSLEGKAARGWLRPGDVNLDGMITKEDVQSVLDTIRNNPASAECDVNGDGRTDIADLQCVVQSMNDQAKESAVERQKIVRFTAVQAAEGTTAVGMEGFLNHTGDLELVPADSQKPIAADNPVSLDFTLAGEKEDLALIPRMQGMTICAPAESEPGEAVPSAITDGDVTVVYADENGQEQTMSVPLAAESQAAAASYRMARAAAPSVQTEPDGSLVLDFGTQIAVKRVLIRITGTKKTEPLVNIAKVEFVNNMEDRVPPPQLDIPAITDLVPGDKMITASWTPQNNVTGYEVCVSGPVKGGTNETQIVRVSNPQHIITGILDKNLIYNGKYAIKVRSVNGGWNSSWSEEKIAVVKAQSLPAAPDYVKAAGGYCSISVSWKDMEDSDGYMVYYKKAEEPDTAFRPVVEGFTETPQGTGMITENKYVIMSLESGAEYDVYVKGWNEVGWGPASLHQRAAAKGVAPKLPAYKLINTSNGPGKKTSHITAAVYGGHGGAHMENSALDTDGKTAWGLVDDDYTSYWTKADWDDGVSYPGADRGMTITLDQDYQMSYITYAAANQQAALSQVRVGYWSTEDPNTEKTVAASLVARTDENDNPFYIIKLDSAITANKVHLSFGTGYQRINMMVGEIHFHQYDSLEDDIMALYTDEMHITLRPDVTAATLDELENRLHVADAASGEKHLLFEELALELKNARDILTANLDPAYEVENQITAQKDRHLGFGGLNSWQPVGKTARAGEKLLVYVGHNSKKWGEAANLQIVFTQNHSEAGGFSSVQNLKVGRNEVTVPTISTGTVERGGQVYVSYTGNSANDKYAVRVNGGGDIPILSVYGKTGEERTAAIQAYVTELEEYVKHLEAEHEAQHTGKANVDYAYDQTNCILNTTDIMMREMMYSVPATQVWAGIKNAEDKTTKLDNALKAMEQAMKLFYQHKGLSDDAGTDRGNNAWPSQHLNIRYMRMFAGAFMYASGNHIGIEWGSTPVVSSPNDISGFGWGIGHEIGHDINQGTYAVAEITNNYFAQLLTGTIRYTQDNVYKKVTSGSIGRASNVFTQLAMYWQLHLAFDNNKDDQYIYDNYQDQFNNLFFARVDTYSRNPGKAPKAGLALNGGADQNLMRLACAAADKNILPFFERWGMVPDEGTIAYANKYGEADTKAIYYVNNEARDYRVDHPETDANSVKNKNAVTASVAANSNQVELNISTSQNKELILGYEISRSMTSNGQKETEVVGFVPIDTAESTIYTDTVATINNRVMEYEVRAVDQYLNYSNPADAGSVKIQTDGVLDKTEWTVETNMVSQDDKEIEGTEQDPDGGFDTNPGNVTVKKEHSIDRVLDNSITAAGTYTGTSNGSAVITIDMRKTQQVTSLKYQGSPLQKVTVEVSADGDVWTKVKTDDASLAGTGEETQTLWFDSVKEEARENWIGTYDARYVRLTISQSGDIVIREIDLCGPCGDNLEFMETAGGEKAIGVLSADYQYGDKPEDVIKEGSLIFTGTYRGNWAYNVVMLYDTKGNVIGAKDGNVEAGQVIFAELPEKGNEGETTEGTWVYYVEPGQWNADTLKGMKVRGELFRVDDAVTLEGERIVSDTQIITVPDTLPTITITGSKNK